MLKYSLSIHNNKIFFNNLYNRKYNIWNVNNNRRLIQKFLCNFIIFILIVNHNKTINMTKVNNIEANKYNLINLNLNNHTNKITFW